MRHPNDIHLAGAHGFQRAAQRIHFGLDRVPCRKGPVFQSVLHGEALQVEHTSGSSQDARNLAPAVRAEQATPKENDGRAVAKQPGLQLQWGVGLR